MNYIDIKESLESVYGDDAVAYEREDLRKEMLEEWVEVERFFYRSSEGSFCVMKRDFRSKS